MKETYEFRVREKYAGLLFGPDEGKKLGRTNQFGDKFVSVRKVVLSGDDPKLRRVGELNAEIHNDRNDYFFHGWIIRRSYTSKELEAGELFLLCHISTFEPAGEECGTLYDESVACPRCQSGAKQISPLFVDWKRIPKAKDIARTIAGEIVVSRRTMELFERCSITGAEFRPVRHRPASSAESNDWFQLLVQSSDADVVSPTRTGLNPFDEDAAGEYRCPKGDLIGLNLLSELYAARASYRGRDIVASRQFIGARRGLLRPERFLLISPKLRRALEQARTKGCAVEIVHLV